MVGILKSKKGSIVDSITIVIVLFILGVVILSMYLVTRSVDTNFQASSQISAEGKTIMSDYNNAYVGRFDTLFGFILFGHRFN